MKWTEECQRWAAEHAREALIERSKGYCERCKIHLGDQGVIHHKAYFKKEEFCLYICKKCHEEIHKLQDEKRFLKRMIKWMGLYTDDVTKKFMVTEARKRLLSLGEDQDIPKEDTDDVF